MALTQGLSRFQSCNLRQHSLQPSWPAPACLDPDPAASRGSPAAVAIRSFSDKRLERAFRLDDYRKIHPARRLLDTAAAKQLGVSPDTFAEVSDLISVAAWNAPAGPTPRSGSAAKPLPAPETRPLCPGGSCCRVRPRASEPRQSCNVRRTDSVSHDSHSRERTEFARKHQGQWMQLG